MPPRKKGAGKAAAAAAAAKRAEKLAAASPPREASASDAAVKSEAAGPAADPSVVEANNPLVVKAEGAEDGYPETKPQANPPQVQPSTASDAGTAPVNQDAAVPVKEEADSLTPCSPARQRFSTPPDDEEIDNSMHQPSELQKQSQAEIKQDLAVTYPESDTEEAASKDQNAEPMVHIEQRLEEIEMEIAEDEAEIEASDAMDTPFSTEKIRHTSPISARVLQNVRALKEEILNGGGNMSGIGRLARFTLDQIDDNPDGEMPDVQGDVTMADASTQGPVRDNAASLSKVDENSSKNVTLLDPSKSDNQSRGNFAGQQYSSTDPWPRSGSGVKRDQLDSGELARGFNPEDSRALKRPRNDPPFSDRRERKSDQDRPSRQFEDSVGSRAGPLRDDDQGARVGRRERFSDQPVYHQLHSRPVHGNVQREEHRDTARGSVRPIATERRFIGAFPDPPRPPPFAPPASQPSRNSNGPPFFPPPAQFSAAAPPPPPAFVPSAQSLGSNASLSAGTKRLTDTASGPHSSPYPSRFNAGFDRENESQQSQKRLPNSAPGSTERRGLQDRMPPLSNARPPVTNRTREESNLANKPPLPSLTAANLGANARHDDAPPRATGRALSKASDDGRSNASEARRLALEGPGTVGPPGRRVPPGSAALRAELEARQQARGVPRYRYVGHIDVERGVLEVPGGLHEDLNGSRPSRFSPDSQSARGPSFNVSSSSMAGRPPADAKPFSTSSAPVRSQDPQRPPFALGPNNSGVQPARDVPDNMFEPHRDFASRSGQGGPVYGGGPMGSQQGFAPSVNARGLDNREIDRRPPIVPPVRQNYDEQVRARPLPYSGDRNVEPSYNAFPHGGPRTNSMQEDLRLAPESYSSRHDSSRGLSPPLSRFSTSSLVEQELAAMKQKIADLERLRALELSVYGGASQAAANPRQASPPRLDQSQRYIPIRDRPPPGVGGNRDLHLRDPRQVGNFSDGQDARGLRNNGNIRDVRPDIRNNGNYRNMQEARGTHDEAGRRSAPVQQVPSHGARYDDRGGPRPPSGFSPHDVGFRGNAPPEQRSQQSMPQFNTLDRSTGPPARNGPQPFMPGTQDRNADRFLPGNRAGHPRDSRIVEGDFDRNQRSDFPRQDNGPIRPFNQRFSVTAPDLGRTQANPIGVRNGIIPARGNGPPPRMDQQAQRGRR